MRPVGTEITKEKFSERDYARFASRLEQCLGDLGPLLGRPGFGTGPATIGAELELFLVDGAARPLPVNQAVRALVADARVAVELNRFNLELNSSPTPLAGYPFTTLGGELIALLDRVGAAARALPRPGRADRRAAHARPGAPRSRRDNRQRPLPGPEQRLAPAPPWPASCPDLRP